MEDKKNVNVEEKPGLCDIILGIFKNFEKNEFVNDRSLIHYTFYELRNKYSLLAELVFKDDVLFPESQMLDEVIYSLQPEFLGKINPSFERFQIKRERINLLWNEELKNKLEKIEPQLKAIAKELEERLKVQEN